MLPLIFGTPGESYKIRKINGTDATRQRLCELGFVLDELVTIVSQRSGDMIVKVKDARIAINREMASRIMV